LEGEVVRKVWLRRGETARSRRHRSIATKTPFPCLRDRRWRKLPPRERRAPQDFDAARRFISLWMKAQSKKKKRLKGAERRIAETGRVFQKFG
jgi:hypothetical protein